MVKHVILWQLKDELSEEERTAVKAGMKESLEALAGQIPGLLEMRVQTEGLPTSNAEVMLYSVFTDAQALAGYAVHPAHVAAADGYVSPYTKNRLCMDFAE
ncbi:MAG: Dabb family protein [Ruminococcaceae bacterium]|nr:Dabb family protein [Oscillospiraceae bacterium]